MKWKASSQNSKLNFTNFKSKILSKRKRVEEENNSKLTWIQTKKHTCDGLWESVKNLSIFQQYLTNLEGALVHYWFLPMELRRCLDTMSVTLFFILWRRSSTRLAGATAAMEPNGGWESNDWLLIVDL